MIDSGRTGDNLGGPQRRPVNRPFFFPTAHAGKACAKASEANIAIAKEVTPRIPNLVVPMCSELVMRTKARA
jgi:hypothetical protein